MYIFENEKFNILLQEIKKIAPIVKKKESDILEILKIFSTNAVSFHEFIEDINKEYSKSEKLSLITILWEVAFADSILDVDEERLIRRIADLIHIKDINVLKIKDTVRRSGLSNL